MITFAAERCYFTAHNVLYYITIHGAGVMLPPFSFMALAAPERTDNVRQFPRGVPRYVRRGLSVKVNTEGIGYRHGKMMDFMDKDLHKGGCHESR